MLRPQPGHRSVAPLPSDIGCYRCPRYPLQLRIANPLYVASDKGHAEVVELLLRAGAKVDVGLVRARASHSSLGACRAGQHCYLLLPSRIRMTGLWGNAPVRV